MKKFFSQEFWMGLAGGVVFAITAWGIDAFIMMQANAALPWLKFAIGLLPCALIGGIAGWLTPRVNNLFLRVLMWSGVAVLFTYLTRMVPFQFSASITRNAYPTVADRIILTTPEAIGARQFIIMVMTIIFLFIAGLIFENVNESIRAARGIVGALLSALFLLAFFAGAGYTADSNFNAELRIPIVALDEKLDYVADVDIDSLDETQERMLRRFTRLEVDFNGPRRMIIGSFDQWFTQFNILVDFEGTFAECSVMNGRASTCKLIE